MINVIHYKIPARWQRLAEPLALNNKLFAAADWIRFITVKVNPLEVRAFIFTTGPSFVIWVGLIGAFWNRGDIVIWAQFPTCCQQAPIEFTIEIYLSMRK